MPKKLDIDFTLGDVFSCISFLKHGGCVICLAHFPWSCLPCFDRVLHLYVCASCEDLRSHENCIFIVIAELQWPKGPPTGAP